MDRHANLTKLILVIAFIALFSISYVDEVVLERDPISYAFSMELEMGETPMLLALKVITKIYY